MNDKIATIKDIVDTAEKIVVIQADNPDADSLGSTLALEHILGDMHKEVSLYCAVTMPSYLRYMSGWDRVRSELPNTFDASIIVDASTSTLLEKLLANKSYLARMVQKPCIVLDHHMEVTNEISFAKVILNDPRSSSTGELIYKVSEELGWHASKFAQEFIMSSILGDTQGLTNQLASSETYRIMATLIDNGVDRPNLEELRRAYSKMPIVIYQYKSMLIRRTEFFADNRIACVVIPQSEINQYSPLYNPAPLILGDMLQVDDVQMAYVLKQYDDGRVTAAIRCNPSAGVAAKLGDHFGGGGHAFAGGFKVTPSKPFDETKLEVANVATRLLDELNKDSNDAPVQYTF